MSTWTNIADALPSANALVMVTGVFDSAPVVTAARLVESWASQGTAAEVWADDVHADPLPFDVTHWQEAPALP